MIVKKYILFFFKFATFHDKTFNARSEKTCLIHSDLFTVLGILVYLVRIEMWEARTCYKNKVNTFLQRSFNLYIVCFVESLKYLNYSITIAIYKPLYQQIRKVVSKVEKGEYKKSKKKVCSIQLRAS